MPSTATFTPRLHVGLLGNQFIQLHPWRSPLPSASSSAAPSTIEQDAPEGLSELTRIRIIRWLAGVPRSVAEGLVIPSGPVAWPAPNPAESAVSRASSPA